MEVKRALEGVQMTRESETRALEDRIAALLQRQHSERNTQRPQSVRGESLLERQKLENGIRAARCEWANEELAELERLRSAASDPIATGGCTWRAL